MHNKNALNLLCLRTTIQIIQELNGLFLIPNDNAKHNYALCIMNYALTSLLVLLLSM